MPSRRRNEQARPFLKWAGGKTQLLPQYETLYPPASEVERYLDPFVGSAAVFFHVRRLLRPRQVILADTNEEIINLYRVVREDVGTVIPLLAKHQAAHSKNYYYRIRALDPGRLSPAARASRLIYLNRTCFNGLYRVNSRGEFNVPMGRYTNPQILDVENLRAVSAALKGVTLKAAHFRGTLRYARKGDFIYLDPPYHPLSQTSSFTAYTGDSFRLSDQEELAEVYARLDRKGCRLMLSNSSAQLIRSLYKDFTVCEMEARRSINSRPDRRGRIHELVVLNYKPSGRVTAGSEHEARARRQKATPAYLRPWLPDPGIL